MYRKAFCCLGLYLQIASSFQWKFCAVQSCDTSVKEPFALFSLSIVASLLIGVERRDTFIHLLLFNMCNQQHFHINVILITSSILNVLCLLHTYFPHI